MMGIHRYMIIVKDAGISVICTQYVVEFPFLLSKVDPIELTFVSDITTSRCTTRHLFNTNKEVH